MEFDDFCWRKASFSAGGECILVAEVAPGMVALRNSNRLSDDCLRLSRTALGRWIAGCKAGEFDDLI